MTPEQKQALEGARADRASMKRELRRFIDAMNADDACQLVYQLNRVRADDSKAIADRLIHGLALYAFTDLSIQKFEAMP